MIFKSIWHEYKLCNAYDNNVIELKVYPKYLKDGWHSETKGFKLYNFLSICMCGFLDVEPFWDRSVQHA